MEDCETGRVRAVKQLAYNKLLSIHLNNNAAYKTGVEDGSSVEQSCKVEKDRMCIILSSRHAKDQRVGGKQNIELRPIRKP